MLTLRVFRKKGHEAKLSPTGTSLKCTIGDMRALHIILLKN